MSSSSSSMILPAHTHAMTLGIFAFVVAFLVMLSSRFIGPQIQKQVHLDQVREITQVLPKSYYDNDPSQTAESVTLPDGQVVHYFMATKAGKPSAVILQSVAQGYSGDIQLLVAIAPDGTLTGVRVLSHQETPGLGDKIEASKSDWILQFKGLSLTNPPEDQWKVAKDGGHFSSFTGATITPRGVVKGIRDSLTMFRANRALLLHTEEAKDVD